MEIIRDFWAFSEISKTIDIFYGYGNLYIRKYISDPSPINFNNIRIGLLDDQDSNYRWNPTVKARSPHSNV